MRAVAVHPVQHGLHGRDTTINDHSHSPFCDRQFAYREKKRGGSSDPPLANTCRRHRLVQLRTGGRSGPHLPARSGRRHTACARSFHPHRDPLCRRALRRVRSSHSRAGIFLLVFVAQHGMGGTVWRRPHRPAAGSRARAAQGGVYGTTSGGKQMRHGNISISGCWKLRIWRLAEPWLKALVPSQIHAGGRP